MFREMALDTLQIVGMGVKGSINPDVLSIVFRWEANKKPSYKVHLGDDLMNQRPTNVAFDKGFKSTNTAVLNI